MNWKHTWVKIFGGVYVDGNTTYHYRGKIRHWFETKSYDFRKKRLLRKCNKHHLKYAAHMAKSNVLKEDCNKLIEELRNFK
jgi:hypothetical protein